MDLFPFLAVLLSAMGVLVLTTMILRARQTLAGETLALRPPGRGAVPDAFVVYQADAVRLKLITTRGDVGAPPAELRRPDGLESGIFLNRMLLLDETVCHKVDIAILLVQPEGLWALEQGAPCLGKTVVEPIPDPE